MHGKLTLNEELFLQGYSMRYIPFLDSFKETGYSNKGTCEFMIERIYFQGWHKE